MRFRTTYPDGSFLEREQSDCNTVEEYVNCAFGGGYDLDAVRIKVEVVGEVVEDESNPDDSTHELEEKPTTEVPEAPEVKEELKPVLEAPKVEDKPVAKAPKTAKVVHIP